MCALEACVLKVNSALLFIPKRHKITFTDFFINCSHLSNSIPAAQNTSLPSLFDPLTLVLWFTEKLGNIVFIIECDSSINIIISIYYRQRSLTFLFNRNVLSLYQSVLLDSDHFQYPEFVMLPSGSRYRLPKMKSNWYKYSFVPCAIWLLNSL